MKTIEHCIPLTINPQAVLDAWQRHSGHLTHSVGRPLDTHHRLVFTLQHDYFKEQYHPVNEEELAGFIAGYVAAWQDCRKPAQEGGLVFVPFDDEAEDKLPDFKLNDDDSLTLSDDNAAPLDWDSVDTSADDSPQMMPSPDQFR